MKKTINNKDDNLNCDDCEICKARDKAEEEGRDLSLEELSFLMMKQNQINFDKKRKNKI